MYKSPIKLDLLGVTENNLLEDKRYKKKEFLLVLNPEISMGKIILKRVLDMFITILSFLNCSFVGSRYDNFMKYFLILS